MNCKTILVFSSSGISWAVTFFAPPAAENKLPAPQTH